MLHVGCRCSGWYFLSIASLGHSLGFHLPRRRKEKEGFLKCVFINNKRVFYSVFFVFNRVTDEVFNFLLVWYYCTLTIRESILISNGSRYSATCKNHGKHEMSLKKTRQQKRIELGTET